ncbi:hypothetical protein RQP46_010890 [Phenoliferia psychrophenolica]
MGDVLEPADAHAASDAAPTVASVSKRSFWGSLVTRTLPKYSGAHGVGVVDIEVPAESPRTFGSFEHSRMPGQAAGLALETVLFTMFYPAVITSDCKERSVWFPKLKQTVNGFLRMASIVPNWLHRMVAFPIAAAAVYGTTFPASNGATLKAPLPDKKWPVIIFSHGVGCSRLMYSAICGELASRGYIVAAVEHRDGTGPSSSIRTPQGKSKVLDFLNWKDLHWPNLHPQPADDTILRHAQLELRIAEFGLTLSVLELITTGQNIENLSILAPQWDWSRWKDAIDVENPIVMGHSLGGSAAIKAAADPSFPFTHCIAEDPAIQRLEPWQSSIPIPLLVINSEEFAVGMDGGDFTRLIYVFDTAPQESSYIFNLPGGRHPSFSDIHLILPGFINGCMGLHGSPESILELSVKTTIAFLRGEAGSLKNRAEQTEGEQVRPIGVPGRLQFYASSVDLRLNKEGTASRGRSDSTMTDSASRFGGSSVALNADRESL